MENIKGCENAAEVNSDQKAKLEYDIVYEDEEGNPIPEEHSNRNDFDLSCSSCGCFVVAAYDEESARYFMEHWNYCPMCGVRFEL